MGTKWDIWQRWEQPWVGNTKTGRIDTLSLPSPSSLPSSSPSLPSSLHATWSTARLSSTPDLTRRTDLKGRTCVLTRRLRTTTYVLPQFQKMDGLRDASSLNQRSERLLRSRAIKFQRRPPFPHQRNEWCIPVAPFLSVVPVIVRGEKQEALGLI